MLVVTGLNLLGLFARDGDQPSAVEQMSMSQNCVCLLYTSDAADEGLGVDLGGRVVRIPRNLRTLSAVWQDSAPVFECRRSLAT